jgi:glycerol uptake facilitator protein
MNMYSNLLGEFLGTMTLVSFGDGVVANLLLKDSKGNGAGWVHVNWGWAFSVMMGIFVASAYGAAEADINPAVTIFKLLAGTAGYTVSQAVLTIVAQMAGGIAGGVIVYLLYSNHWEATEDPGLKLAVFSTGPGRRNITANFMTEVIATVFLIMGIMCIFHKNNGVQQLGPFLVAGLIYVLGSAMGGPTGYALNPARDMGPRIAHAILPIPGKGKNDWQYGLMVATAGPIAAALICVFLYKLSGF